RRSGQRPEQFLLGYSRQAGSRNTGWYEVWIRVVARFAGGCEPTIEIGASGVGSIVIGNSIGRPTATRSSVKYGPSQIRKLAKSACDYETLRPGQQEAIASVLEGRDTLVVMPTGFGKSAIYQIAAHALDGPTVVVSPLIALQRDQQEHLEELNAGRAAVVNSLVPEREQEQALVDAKRGKTEFLFM